MPLTKPLSNKDLIQKEKQKLYSSSSPCMMTIFCNVPSVFLCIMNAPQVKPKWDSYQQLPKYLRSVGAQRDSSPLLHDFMPPSMTQNFSAVSSLLIKQLNCATLSSFTIHACRSSSFLSIGPKRHHVSHLTGELVDIFSERRTSQSTTRWLGGVARLAASRANHTTGVLLWKDCETRPAKARQRCSFNLDKGKLNGWIVSPQTYERKNNHMHVYFWAQFA